VESSHDTSVIVVQSALSSPRSKTSTFFRCFGSDDDDDDDEGEGLERKSIALAFQKTSSYCQSTGELGESMTRRRDVSRLLASCLGRQTSPTVERRKTRRQRTAIDSRAVAAAAGGGRL